VVPKIKNGNLNKLNECFRILLHESFIRTTCSDETCNRCAMEKWRHHLKSANGWLHQSSGDSLFIDRDPVKNQFLQIQLAAGIIEVNTGDVAILIVIQNDPGRNFPALLTGFFTEIDVHRVRIWIIGDFHGLYFLSGKAL
jgi:hypothetical protein